MTYDVVVNVENPELLLKPGMTANVNVVTASKAKVVRVPIDAPPAFRRQENRRRTPRRLTERQANRLESGCWRIAKSHRSRSPPGSATERGSKWPKATCTLGDRVVTDEVRGAVIACRGIDAIARRGRPG